MWFFLWFILSIVILGVTAWSTIILIQQKRAWKKYAEQKGLIFTANKFLEPCSVEGIIDNIYRVSLFTATQIKEDSRNNRQITVMQVNVENPFGSIIALGTTEMHLFIKSLEETKPFKIDHEKWPKDYLVRASEPEQASTYLTEERLKIFDSILKMPKSDTLVILGVEESVFRFETSNPLSDPQQIDSAISKLIKRIKKLQPTEECTNSLMQGCQRHQQLALFLKN